MVLTTVSAVLFLVVFFADLLGLHTNPYLGVLFFLILPAVFVLGIWFLMQLLSGVGSIAQVEAGTGGVAFWAHVAGFAVGVMGGLLLRRPERERVEYWHDR